MSKQGVVMFFLGGAFAHFLRAFTGMECTPISHVGMGVVFLVLVAARLFLVAWQE